MRRLFFLLAFLVTPTMAWSLPRHLPVPGGVAVLELPTTGGVQRVFFNDKAQAVVQEKGRWYALIGIPLDVLPGQHAATLRVGTREAPLSFTIKVRNYPTQNLRIPDSSMVTPPPELEARIEAEQARIAELKQYYSMPAPDTRFVLPAEGRRSSRFGVRRILNGEPRSPHAGLDVAVAVGAPLRAPAPGRVIAVADFYFTGKTVVIDHGQGVLTLYAHLSRIDAEEGQVLERGEKFGASGVSGRITGPHLHWVVILGGTAVDPELFLPAR